MNLPWHNAEFKDQGDSVVIRAPAGLTILKLRDQFGIDPGKGEPCFYNQDWYLTEDFASKTVTDNVWHTLPKRVKDEWRGKDPNAIEKALGGGEKFPTAVIAAFAFFATYLSTGERLWKHDFLWTSDHDHNGDRIYVGRYEDPAGMNKNGFNVHRLLSIRENYSAAPDKVSN